jgi:hypothetical protein
MVPTPGHSLIEAKQLRRADGHNSGRHVSAVKRCPKCGGPIDLMSYWAKAPKTRLGFPAAGSADEPPGLVCPGCGAALVMTAGLLSAATVILWSAVGIGILATPGLDRLTTLERFLTVAAVIASAFIIQRAAAPFLLDLTWQE